MEPRISIVTIATDDLDRAVRFYEGMGLKRHAGITEGVAYFQMGGAILGCSRARMPRRTPGSGSPRRRPAVYLAYNTRSDAEVDEVLAAAERAGGRIVKPAGNAFWGGWYGYFADADGHVWEVAHNPAFPIDAAETSRCRTDNLLDIGLVLGAASTKHPHSGFHGTSVRGRGRAPSSDVPLPRRSGERWFAKQTGVGVDYMSLAQIEALA